MKPRELIETWLILTAALYEETASIKAQGRQELFYSDNSYFTALVEKVAEHEAKMSPELIAMARKVADLRSRAHAGFDFSGYDDTPADNARLDQDYDAFKRDRQNAQVELERVMKEIKSL